MLVHLYSRGEDFFDQKLSVHEACQLIELQQTVDEEEESFIGFTHPDHKDATVQFIRIKKNEWIMDIPMFKGETYLGTMVTKIDHSHVLIIVNTFYHPTEFQHAIIVQDYSRVREISAMRWKIAYDILRE